ncbi:MAG: helix-turn-helix domain-containing protein [Blastocatellales bacterium]|nr:helix-turn-helix domain-containing protein [Blastocatellales bacterium]
MTGICARQKRAEALDLTRPPIVPHQTYSVPEAAIALGVSTPTMWRWLASRRIAHARCGRRVIFLGEHLLGFIEAQTVSARAA